MGRITLLPLGAVLIVKKIHRPSPPQIETYLRPGLISLCNHILLLLRTQEARLSGHRRVGVRTQRSTRGGLGEEPPPSFSRLLLRAAGVLSQGSTKSHTIAPLTREQQLTSALSPLP